MDNCKVKEIPYDYYKRFCSFLPSKDVLFYLNTLFAIFPGDSVVYAIKTPIKKKSSDVYKNLVAKEKITEYTLSEFVEDLPFAEGSEAEKKYKGQNILVRIY